MNEFATHLASADRNGIKHRILDPTNIVYQNQKERSSLRVFLPDLGFSYVGVPGSEHEFPIAVERQERWKGTLDFSLLWAGKSLRQVNAGLPSEQEKVAIARLYTWVLTGKLIERLPDRDDSFWNEKDPHTWALLKNTLSAESLQNHRVPKDFYRHLHQTPFANHFLQKPAQPKRKTVEQRRSIKPLLWIAALGILCAFIPYLYSLVPPRVPPSPAFAIWPSSKPGTKVFERLGAIQEMLYELREFEQTRIAKSDRYESKSRADVESHIDLDRKLMALNSNQVQEYSLSDIVRNFQLIESLSQELKGLGSEMDSDDEVCRNNIGAELQIHLFYAAQSLYKLQYQKSVGLKEVDTYIEQLSTISSELEDYKSITPLTQDSIEMLRDR